MIRKIKCLVFFLLVSPLSQAQETYLLDVEYPVHDLQKALKVLPDPDDILIPEQLLFDQVLPYQDGSDLPKYLEPGITYWGKLDLLATDSLRGWTLHFEDNRIGLPAWSKSNGKVDVFAYRGDTLIFHKRTGVEYPKSKRDKSAHWVLNQISLEGLPVQTPIRLIIRVQGNSFGYPAYFNLSARSPSQAGYHRIYQFHNSFNIFMFGVTFIIFLYHLLQFLYLRERVFLWFSVWLLFCTLTQAMVVGLIIGNLVGIRYLLWLFIANSTYYAFWFFGREFIKTKEKFPKLDKAILALAFLVLMEIIIMGAYVIIAHPQPSFIRVGMHFQFLSLYTVASLVLSIVLMLKKDAFARYFGVGALIGSLALIIGNLWSLGIIVPPIDPYATSMFLQVVIYSFGIAYRQQVLTQQSQNEKLKAQQNLAEMQRMKDLDEIKTRFFTNISHEFRTPLALISGPLNQALEGAESNNISLPKRSAEIIRKNTSRLQNLVDQLLELSRLESGKLHLSLQKGGLMPFLSAVFYSFESMAERENINLNISLSKDNPEACFDKDKLEKILTNLLSNAFKYTPSGGMVSVAAELNETHLNLEISDTGEGIGQSELKHIFERFYRVEGTEKKGSGIGLALTKELVDLHRGNIKVRSVQGRGTTFKVRLPITLQDLPANKPFLEKEEATPEIIASSSDDPRNAAQKTTDSTSQSQEVALVVEDNADLRHFISSLLEEHYHVLSAEDGAQGERMALEHIPDIVISDVMMPKRDGYQLCNSLKRNPKTSHIPIILLTAKAGQSNKMEGLLQGADAYLTKPFDHKEMLLRVKNLLESRKKLWNHFKSQDMFLIDDLDVKSIDDRFLQDVFKTIKNNLDNEQFGVDNLLREIGFSRTQLHRKLKALLGKSANQLIIEMRLNEAHRMLREQLGSVTEVAFAVGYSNLSYFAKSFKNKFGLLPSEVKKGEGV